MKDECISINLGSGGNKIIQLHAVIITHKSYRTSKRKSSWIIILFHYEDKMII